MKKLKFTFAVLGTAFIMNAPTFGAAIDDDTCANLADDVTYSCKTYCPKIIQSVKNTCQAAGKSVCDFDVTASCEDKCKAAFDSYFAANSCKNQD